MDFPITLPIEKHLNHCGKFFGYHIITSIGSSATLNFTMKTSATYYQHFLSPIVISDRQVEIYYYKDATFTGGLDVLSNILSNNHVSTNVTTVQQMVASPSIGTEGTMFYCDYLPATNQSSFGASSITIGWVLAKDTIYRAKIVNKNAQAGTVKFSLFWTEE